MNRQEFRKINCLSSERYNELKRRYYETNDSTKRLVQEFNLVGISLSQLYLIFDDVETDIKCPHCGAFMKHKPTSRTTQEVSEWFCTNCNHEKYKYEYRLCCCLNCENQRRKQLNKFLENEHSKNSGCLENLNLREKLFLGSLIYRNNNISTNFYYEEDDFSFFDDEIERDAISSIYKKNCIVISLQSELNQFGFSNNNIKFNGEQLNYKNSGLLNLPFDLWLGEQDRNSLINGEIIDKKHTKELWKLINTMEATYYFKKILNSYYIKNYNDDEIIKVVLTYIDTFSLAETLSAINFVTSNHSNQILGGKITRKEGLQEMLNHLYSYYKWAKENSDKLRYYSNKIKITELTCLTRFFYKVVIKNDKALYECVENDG